MRDHTSAVYKTFDLPHCDHSLWLLFIKTLINIFSNLETQTDLWCSNTLFINNSLIIVCYKPFVTHVFIVSGTVVWGLIMCYHIIGTLLDLFHLVSHILSWPTDQFLDGLWCGSGSAGKSSAAALKLNLSGSPCCVFECNILCCTHAVISCLSKVLSLSVSLPPSTRTHPFSPSLLLLHPLHLCAQGSSEACSWLRPPLLWAKDSAGGQGSGSSLKKSRQIKDKKYWGRKK